MSFWKRRSRILLRLCGFLLFLLIAASVYYFRMADPFYDVAQTNIAGKPGSLIRAQSTEAFAGAKAWRVLYRSTGLNGEPIVVSGIIVAPDNDTAAHPIVAWAHGTLGIASKCAPSRDKDVLGSIPGLAQMIAQGFVVTATDYALTPAGTQYYLIGVSEAHAVLDSVRAAREWTKASDRFAVWGHSQGGHAALWTGELSASYAPELKLAGVAAAAPAINLAALFEGDHATPVGRLFTALALQAWSQVYDKPLSDIVDAKSLTSVKLIGEQCLNSRVDLLIDEVALRGIDAKFIKTDPVTTEPWKSFIAQNSLDHLPSHIPLLIAQGESDTVVHPNWTDAFVKQFCAAGGKVQLIQKPAGHLSILPPSVNPTIAWIADRFKGKPAPSNCAF